MKSALTEDEKKLVKKLLWEGVSRRDIVGEVEYKVGTALLGRVVQGDIFGNIPWPDGSMGRMSEEQKGLRAQARKINVPPNILAARSGKPNTSSPKYRAGIPIDKWYLYTDDDTLKMIEEWDDVQIRARENTLDEAQIERELAWLHHRQDLIESGELSASERLELPPPAAKKFPEEVPHENWEDVRISYCDLAVVKLAEDDPILQEAICIVFASPMLKDNKNVAVYSPISNPDRWKRSTDAMKVVAHIKMELDKYYATHSPLQLPC